MNAKEQNIAPLSIAGGAVGAAGANDLGLHAGGLSRGIPAMNAKVVAALTPLLPQSAASMYRREPAVTASKDA
jgi:hypothetical protein